MKTQKKLGEGEFGIVYKGEWKQLGRETVPAALKTLKPTASNDERLKLLREAAIMGQFNHPHIVKLYGVVKDIQAVSALSSVLLNTIIYICCLGNSIASQ